MLQSSATLMVLSTAMSTSWGTDKSEGTHMGCSGTYRMKVEDIEHAVAVTRIK